MRTSVATRLRWRETVLVQAGAGFISAITPVAVGGLTANQSYLQEKGATPAAAAAAVGVNLVLTTASHVALLVLMLPFLPGVAAADALGCHAGGDLGPDHAFQPVSPRGC